MNVSARIAGRKAIAGLVAAAALIGGLEYQRVFGWNRSLMQLVGAVAIPAGVAIWVSRKPADPAPLPFSGMISLICLLGYLLVTVGGPAPVLDALISGWSRILTTTLPVTDHPELLAFPALLAWLCTFAGVETALRARLPHAGFLPPLFLMGSAVFFGSRGDGASLVLAGLFCFVLLAAFVVNLDVSGDTRVLKEAGPRRVTQSMVTGLLVAGSCSLLAASLGPGLPLAQANDPYEAGLDAVSSEELASVNPLARLAGWALAPDQVLFEVTSERPALWRLAVLDRYDPESGWYMAPDLQFFGGVLSPQTQQTPVESLEYQVEVVELPGIWIPAADRPVRASGKGLLVDEGTGVLVQPGGLEPGARYALTSALSSGPTDCARVISSPTPVNDAGGILPQEFMDVVNAFNAETASPCEKVRAIEAYLKEGGRRIDPQAPSGSSIWRILRFLGSGAEGGSGTSEQFASAFALLANATGMPARVAVGFHAGEQNGSTWTVRAGDAHAYVELQSSDQRWIPFDPSPVALESSRPPVPGILDLEVTGLEEPATDPAQVPDPTADDGTASPAQASQRNLVGWMRLAGIAAGLSVSLLALAVLIKRRHLRSTRLRGRAGQRVIGAWRQAVDEMRGSGVRVPPSSTVSDCVNYCKEVVGREQAEILVPLGSLANSALFSMESAAESSAQRAWQLSDEFQRTLSAHRTVRDKLRYALDPRVLAPDRSLPTSRRPAAPGRSPAAQRRRRR